AGRRRHVPTLLPSSEAAREGFPDGQPGRPPLAEEKDEHQLDRAPAEVDVDHRLPPRGDEELHHPEDEQNQRLVEAELHVLKEEESEEALQDGEEDLLALERVERQRAQLAG